MDCQPQDDSCTLQRAYDSYMQEIREDDQIDRTMISLGNFNGKAYTFYKVGKKTIILITPVDAEEEDQAQFLESSDNDTGEGNHG